MLSLFLVVALAVGTPAAAHATTSQTPARPAPSTPAPAETQTQPPATQPPATQSPAGQTGAAAPSQIPTAPTPAVPASRKFATEAGVMFSLILPAKTADFEAVLARVKEALGKSQDPKRKQQALGWRVMKGTETGPGGNIVYMWLFDPAVKDFDYSITTILLEAFPSEAQDLWAKYTACFASPQSMLSLTQVLSMGPAGTGAVPK